MTTTMAATSLRRMGAHELARLKEQGSVTIIDVREPVEYVGGHIPGSINIPLSQLGQTQLPDGPLVLVCQSGNRSTKGLAQLIRLGHGEVMADLEGGVPAWQQAGYRIARAKGAPLPLMRQVQIAAGALVLLGVILSQTVATAWIWLAGFVGAGLVLAGATGFCGMASLLAAMPWNRVKA